MNDIKQIYQELHKAIENNEMELIFSSLEKINVILENENLSDEDRHWMIEQTQFAFECIEERHNTIHKLLVDMNTQSKIAKKYEQE